MVTKISGGKLILPEGIVENKSVYYENGTIIAVTDKELPFDCEKKANGNYVSPGFIDLHVHGGGGYEFVDATEEAVIKACEMHFKHGTTTIYPTFSSYSDQTVMNSAKVVREVKEKGLVKCDIAGIHLEGPYFSPKQTGAQKSDQLRTPKKEEFGPILEEYSDIIKRWSYAPEVDVDLEFIKSLNDYNIKPSAAHTDAEYSHMMDAFNNGLDLITHLYSCTSTITRKSGFRILGVIETAFLVDDIAVETIADGCHLPPALLKMIYKIKGPDKICLVTDSIRPGGLADSANPADLETEDYVIEDGVAKLKDKAAFAGSIATADVLVRTCVKKAGIPLTDAVKMITQTPATIMNLDKKGKIMYGYDAEFVIFDEDINVVEVIR